MHATTVPTLSTGRATDVDKQLRVLAMAEIPIAFADATTADRHHRTFGARKPATFPMLHAISRSCRRSVTLSFGGRGHPGKTITRVARLAQRLSRLP
jgi:hypothetical protein